MNDQIENLREKMKNYQEKLSNVNEDHLSQLEKVQAKLFESQ